MFNIHRGYRRSSSSDEEPGRPPAGHPQPPGLQLPASGGGPQRPGLSRTHRVRRALFGRSDPEENIRFVRQVSFDRNTEIGLLESMHSISSYLKTKCRLI